MSTILRAILRQATSLLVCLTSLYLGLLGLSLLVSRPNHEEERGLDTSLASNSVLPVHGNSIFLTEPQYIYLNRAPLRNAAEKVVLLGASNLELGFDLTEFRALLPANVVVHKLALPGANMTEEHEVIDLVQEVQSKEARQHEILVLGIWYGMFGEDRLVWFTPDRSVPGDTELDTELYRYSPISPAASSSRRREERGGGPHDDPSAQPQTLTPCVSDAAENHVRIQPSDRKPILMNDPG